MKAGDRLEFAPECFDRAPRSCLGTVKSVENGEAIIELDGGETVRLPIAALKAVGV